MNVYQLEIGAYIRMKNFDNADEISILENSQIKIKQALEEHEKGKDNLMQMLALLNAMNVNAYPFSVCANEVAVELSVSDINTLEKKLDKNPIDDKNFEELKKAFVMFYLVTYKYYRTDKLNSFRDALNKYENLFLKMSDDFALLYQIKGRFSRSVGDVKKALDYDKKAISILNRKGIHNTQVDITYARTVLKALQENNSLISTDDINDAVKKVESAIKYNPNVSRYYSLLARFKMYGLLSREDIISPDQYILILNEAKELLNTAIEIENPDMDSYATTVANYKEMINDADSILRQVRFNNRSAELLKRRITEVEKEAKETQNRYLEILAVFVAIIAIIMAMVEGISSSFSYNQLIAMIITFNAGLLAVYSTFLALIRSIKLKYVLITLLCIVIQLLVIATVNGLIVKP